METGEATVPTRLGSSKCSINFVPCSPYFLCISPQHRGRNLNVMEAQWGPGNPTFQIQDRFQTWGFKRWVDHSIKPELPKIIVLSLILKWVANYGLKKLKMEISRYLGPNCTHQKSTQTSASAKYCSIFPSIEINVSQDWCWFFSSQLLSLLRHKWLSVLGKTPHECMPLASIPASKNPTPQRGTALKE